MRDTLQSEIGPFASIPVWVIDACRDANAIAVYAVLARHANRERRAWPGQERIGGVLNMSVSTVQRAMKVLRDVGAVLTEPRRSEGVIVGTSYVLLAKNPNKSYTSQVMGRTQPLAVKPATCTSLHVTGDGGGTSQVSNELDPVNQIQKLREQDPRAREETTAATQTAAAVEDWRERWRKLYGYESTLIESPMTFADAARQLAAIGRQGWREALDGYFSATDAFVLRSRHSLALFAKDPNKWRAKERIAATAEGVRQQTRQANVTQVSDGRMQGILARDNPELFK